MRSGWSSICIILHEVIGALFIVIVIRRRLKPLIQSFWHPYFLEEGKGIKQKKQIKPIFKSCNGRRKTKKKKDQKRHTYSLRSEQIQQLSQLARKKKLLPCCTSFLLTFFSSLTSVKRFQKYKLFKETCLSALHNMAPVIVTAGFQISRHLS